MAVLTSLFARPAPPGLVLASCQSPGLAKQTASVKKNTHACLITTGRSLRLVFSTDLPSETKGLLVTRRYCRLFSSMARRERKKVLIFKVLAAVQLHTHTLSLTHPCIKSHKGKYKHIFSELKKLNIRYWNIEIFFVLLHCFVIQTEKSCILSLECTQEKKYLTLVILKWLLQFSFANSITTKSYRYCSWTMLNGNLHWGALIYT